MRLAREGMLLRAVAWPGLLSSLALVGTAVIVGILARSPTIAVGDEAVAAVFRDDGFVVEVVADPAATLAAGDAARAAWQEAGHWVLGSTEWGRTTLRAEAALRRHVDRTWQIEVAAPPTDPRAVEGPANLLASLIAVLFSLYGVVMGAGVVVRDRDDGVMEVELSMAVPGWMHGAARVLACGGALVAFETATLLLMDGLLGIPAVGAWGVQGAAASLAGLGIGMLGATGWRGSVAFRPPGGEGLSGPLSRSLTLTTGALALGWALPKAGAWLPLCSVTSLARAGEASIAPLLGAVCLAGLTVWRFGRDEWSA